MVTPSKVGQLQRELANHLHAHLDLPEPWLAAFGHVPRHLFLPARAWQLTDGELVPVDQDADPQRWLQAAYSDDAIVTQVDGDTPTSSCSMPYLVLGMLQLLGVEPGHRVLEIGTGTGWNAALLAHRVGPDQVTTIEVDADLAEQARRSLAAAGIEPVVVTGDGAVGYPDRAPYDRVIATCAVHQVPYSWVEQTVDDGVVVVPWDSPLGLGGLLRLTVNNGTASGPFVDTSSFMWLRAQQPKMPDAPDDFDHRATSSTGTVKVADVRDNLARFVIGLMVEDCQPGGYQSGESIWLFASDSWASVDVANGTVRQLGQRRLWDEVEAAYRWWESVGHPDLTRFGVSVTRDRQWVWLDHPDQPLPRP